MQQTNNWTLFYTPKEAEKDTFQMAEIYTILLEMINTINQYENEVKNEQFNYQLTTTLTDKEIT